MSQQIDLNAEVEQMGNRIQELLVKLSRSPEDLIQRLLEAGYVFDLYYTGSGCRLFLESELEVSQRLSLYGQTDVAALQQAVDQLITSRGVEHAYPSPAARIPARHRPR